MMNLQSFVLLAAIAAGAFFAYRAYRKNGACSCGGSCSGCTGNCACCHKK